VSGVTRALGLATLVFVIAGCAHGAGKPDAQGRGPAPIRVVATESREVRGDYLRFHSEKDIHPPKVEVEMGPAKGTSAGRIFLTPRAANAELASGPTILDAEGRMLWFLPRPGRVTSDLKAQVLKGKPVLTWGERAPVTTPAEIFTADPKELFFVVADQSYRPFLRVRAIGEGVGTDMHELVITKKNTALLIGFKTVRRSLRSVGRDATWDVVDSIVQEIDLTTGKLLLDWSALEHVPMSDSMFELPKKDAWDAYHANSVAVTDDGNLLVSMRHTSAIYKIERRTGRVLWTFGGKSSDFDVSERATFHFQHDAQPLGDGKVLLFDNGATFTDRVAPYSRVEILQLDGAAKSARLVQEIVRDRAILVVSQGNARRLPNGDIFVGWGNRQWFSEYTPAGQQLFDAALPSVAYQSYRALKGDWTGRPKTKPAVVADRKRGRTLIWVSWNGATQVARWRVLGGPTETTLRPVGSADREGFETRLDVAAAPRDVRVQALGRDGKVLATSAAVRPG
jgi:Arylsulfotransferase (ASST)